MGKYLIKTKPWKHQKQAFKYLMNRDLGALYTTMGSGKTKVMIDLINNRHFNRVLVVCTNKACELGVWEKQFRLHSYNEEINVWNLSGLSADRKVDEAKKRTNSVGKNPWVIIVNYESVWREPFKSWLLNKAKLDCVICDESHRIKSPGSKVSGFLTTLARRVPHRYMMTGTPLSQSPLDIYAQYRYLDPTIFGTRYDEFKAEYANFVQRDGYEVFDKKKPYKNLEQLHEKMYSCAFYVDADLDLPPFQDIPVYFHVSPKTEKIYKDVKKDCCVALKQGNMAISCALTLILRLQQLTSGFLPVKDLDGEEHIVSLDNSRAEALKSLLEDIESDEPVVVFAKYRKDLKNIKKAAKMLGRKYSELSGRKDTTQRWLDGKTTILGVQLQAGAESIDLTRARYCVYYTMSHSLAQYEQSRARVRRPGQTRPVVYYTLIGLLRKGESIDEQIFAGLRQTKDVIDYIIKRNV